MGAAFFVTSSGTEIGKTFVTSLIVRGLVAEGRDVSVLKPVMSGFDKKDLKSSDAGHLLAAAGQEVTPDTIAAIAPWAFAPAISPDMAAKREGRSIDFEELIGFCKAGMMGAADATFVEAAGGIMAPLSDDKLMLDWAAALNIPTLLVVGSYLGTISHTLTALAALQSRGVPLKAIILNESEHSPVPLRETKDAIARFAPGVAIHMVARDERNPAVLNAALFRS